ncbi:MAG: HIT family protein [Deltaproteobacteria bacterium]|nr:HIT family protein [Deltaproteobacteria bacterium]
MDSVFSHIIERKLPAEIVYEDDMNIAFLDISPKTEGHTLVVPKRQVSSYQDLSPEEAASLARAMQMVIRGVVQGMETPHYNLTLNNGDVAGQVVFHVHFHIIPRYKNLPRGPLGKYPEGRMAEVARLIRNAMPQP